ncbi:MAG TPA: dihydrolipoamide acetyltransferase family protein [Tepidiformaceae bacterium]|nr:dihydrolipoamide acetyltransferase family protein [Tepidiformaceae bacterium]
MPQLGESVTEGTLLAWLKQPGEVVTLDEPLCTIETEKVTDDLPSPFAGIMLRHLVGEGETVPVLTPLCEIEGPGDSPNGPTHTLAGSSAPAGEPGAHSPAVRRLAEAHGVDLSAIAGSGEGGRVTRKDVEAYLGQGNDPQGPDYDVIVLSRTRQTIAANLLRSVSESPQAWTMVEVDATALQARLEAERSNLELQGVHATVLPFFVEAVCTTLRQLPALNARWEGAELRRYRRQHIGIAVAAESGLIVPVIRDAGALSATDLAIRIADLAGRAREQKLSRDDVSGGTFTVNNTGAFGSITSMPIVNYPEVAILTMERITRRPVVTATDDLAIRPVFNVCLTFDHRALDGAEAGAFLAALKARLEGDTRL